MGRRNRDEISPADVFQPNKEAIDNVKLQVCNAISRIALWRQWRQSQLAIYMGTSRANASRVQNKKLDQLTLTQLFNYLSKIDPHFRFILAVSIE